MLLQAVFSIILSATLLLMPAPVQAVPAVPVPGSAVAVTQTGFDASWGAVDGALGYQLDVASNLQFSSFVSGYASLDAASATSYSVSGLLPGTTYYYRVRAYDGSGVSQNSTIGALVTLAAIPAVPTVGTPSGITRTGFTAVWGTQSVATGYQVDVATDLGFTSLVSGFASRDAGNVGSIAVTGLTADTTYFYRVRAYNAGGVSPSSGPASVTTLLDAPAIPFATGAQSVTASGFNAAWNAAAHATGYRLDVSAKSDFSTFVIGYNNKDVGNVALADVSGLPANTTHYYRVRAYNANGTSANSVVSAVVTQSTMAGSPVATNPSGITKYEFTATWNDVTPATGIELDVATDPLFDNKLPGYQSLLIPYATSYRVTGLNPVTIYYYRIRGNDNGVSGPNSNVIAVVTLPGILGVPAVGTASVVTSSGFNAVWGAATGATGYLLDVASDSGFVNFVSGYNGRDVGNVTGFVVGGLSPASGYYYRVRSYNNGGISISSNMGAVVTLPAIPAVPQPGVPLSVGQFSFTAVWGAVSGATGYRLDVSTSVNFATFVTGNNNRDTATSTSATVSSLTAGTVYYYRVRSYNTGGTSSNSSIGAVVTLPATPAVPTALATTAITLNSFTANWGVASGATGYFLDVATDSSFTSPVSGATNRDVGSATSTGVSGLQDGTTYYYRVRSYNNGGTSASSVPKSTATLPVAPVSTDATAVVQAGFTANWNAVRGATSYSIDVATNVSFNPILTNKTTTGATSVAVASLTAGTTYYYRVRAATAGGFGANSNAISLSTIPLAPGIKSATLVFPNSFAANWNVATGAAGYYLDVATDAAFTNPVSGFAALDVGNATTAAVAGLSAGTTYYYRVRAYNSGGISPNSTSSSTATLPVPPLALPATTISQTGFTSNWGSTSGAIGYRLDVSTDPAFTANLTAYDNKDVKLVTTSAVTGLSAGTTYYYRVRAVTAGGSGDNSNSISLVTIPPVPVVTSATLVSPTGFTANWSSALAATGYLLDVASNSTFTSLVTGYNALDTGTNTSAQVNGLLPGTLYYYRVRAVNAGGASGNSLSITVSTLATPTAIAATAITQTGFIANWNAAGGATGYLLDVATDSAFTALVPAYNGFDAGNFTSTTVSGLIPGVTYYYRIKAYTPVAITGYSNTITQITLATPQAAPASTITQTGFTASWGKVEGADGYAFDVASDASFFSILSGYNDKRLTTPTSTSVAVTGLVAGSTYYYRVRSYNKTVTSVNSAVVTVITVPLAPDITSATDVNQTGFTINWAAARAATGYELDVSTNPTFTLMVTGFNRKDVGSVSSQAVSGLSVGTLYYYRLRSYNGSGMSTSSGTVSQSTLATPVATAAAAITQTSFNATWNASGGASGYRLDVAADSLFQNMVSGYNNLDVGNVTSAPVTGLLPGATYYYRVRGYTPVALTGNSIVISQITLATPVAILATVITQTSFKANWLAVSGAKGYYLDVAVDPGFTSILGNYENKNVLNVTGYAVSGLSIGVTYYYRVRAYNDTPATTTSSNVISPTTFPSPPVGSAATMVTQTGFVANWNYAVGASGYRLDVSTNSAFATFVDGYNDTDVANVISYPVSGLSAGVTYYYRIRAYNNGGTSANSVPSITQTTVPPAPIATPATTITQSGFKAVWNAANGAASYLLDVAVDSGFTTLLLTYSSLDVKNVTSYTVSGLDPGTTYYYRLRAVNNGGTSPNSNVVSQATMATPVAAAATLVASTGFTANWGFVNGASTYQLDVSTSSTFSTYVTGYNNRDVGNVLSHALSNLTAGATYFYRVRAVNAGVTSTNSNVITQGTLGTPVAAPATSITQTGFTAVWNTTSAANGYLLEVASDSSFAAILPGFSNGGLDVGLITSYVLQNSTPGTQYFYRVRAYSSGGASANSNSISLTTLPPTPQSPTAAPATGVTQYAFVTNWFTASGASGYRLDLSTDPVFGSFVSGYNNRDVGNVTSFALSGLSAGTTYYYRIRAYNSGGTSSSSVAVSQATLPPTPPDSPVAAAASSLTSSGFTASWNAVIGATGYVIDVALDPAFASLATDYTNRDIGNVTSFAVSGLPSGSMHYYRVRAYNLAGTSPVSNSITVTVKPGAPLAAALMNISPGGFVLNWSSVAGASGYIVDIATDAGFVSIVGAYSGKDMGVATTLAASGLTAGSAYYCRVRAYNGGGTGANSNTVDTVTLPGSPLELATNTVTKTDFNVVWGLVSGALGYRIDVALDPGFTQFVTGYNNLDTGNITTVAVSGLSAGSTYYIRLRAYTGGGIGANSAVAIQATLPPPPAAAVATPATTILPSGFTATWGAVYGASGYRLDVSPAEDFSSFVVGFYNYDVGTVTSYDVIGLTPGSSYYYRVRAYNSGGDSIDSNVISVVAASAPLTVTVSGSGGGSVNSNPAGIACVSGLPDSCSATYDGGIAVTLTATPDSGSAFAGWSGGCSGMGGCVVPMDSARDVTATFILIKPVRIFDAVLPRYFDTLQEAYTAVGDGETIQVTDRILAGGLVANRPVGVSIVGGYDAGYSANTLDTMLQGVVRIQQGSVRMEKVKVGM